MKKSYVKIGPTRGQMQGLDPAMTRLSRNPTLNKLQQSNSAAKLPGPDHREICTDRQQQQLQLYCQQIH